MNKLIHRIYKLRHFSWLIAFLLGGIFFNLSVKASAPMPTPDASTIEIVEVVTEMLNSMMFTSHYLDRVTTDEFNDAFDFGVLPYTDLWNWDTSDFNVEKLSSDELSLLLLATDLYNENNIQLNSNDDVYLLTFNNGFFTGNAYIDDNGELIYKDNNTIGDKLLQIALGGDILDTEEMISIYDDLANEIISTGYNLPSENIVDVTTLTNIDRTLYFYFGIKARLYSRLDLVYIPDMYNSNFYFNSPGVPLTIYSDLNPNQFITNHGTDNTTTYNSTNNQTINNKVWNYKLQFPTNYQVCTLSEYNSFSFSSGTHPYLIDYNGNTFNPQYYEYVQNNDVIRFEKLVSDNNSYVFDGTKAYSYKDLNDAQQTLNNIQIQPNPNYDPEEDIGINNYPSQKIIPENFSVSESNLPLPNTTPYPSPNYSPSLTYNPDIQPSFDNAINSFQNLQIPFINGISDRYPFSIPWDIAKFISRFSSEPTPPAWNFDWNITVGNTTYTKHFEGDLSDFNGLAEIFRNLILISFIIALCKFSYDHHF